MPIYVTHDGIIYKLHNDVRFEVYVPDIGIFEIYMYKCGLFANLHSIETYGNISCVYTIDGYTLKINSFKKFKYTASYEKHYYTAIGDDIKYLKK